MAAWNVFPIHSLLRGCPLWRGFYPRVWYLKLLYYIAGATYFPAYKRVINVYSVFVVNVWGKCLKLPQLTHESFLTIDHSCKIFFWYLPNWTSTNLWCVVLYATYSTTHQRSVEVQFGRYQKNILQEWSIVKNLSSVSWAAWNVFSINSLLSGSTRRGGLITTTRPHLLCYR